MSLSIFSSSTNLLSPNRADSTLKVLFQQSHVDTAKSADLNDLLATAKKNLRFFINISQAQITSVQLPTVKVKSLAIIQLFQNLISNSVKFCQKGILPIIQVNVEQQGGYYLISVKNNSTSVDPTSQAKLFAQGKGLAICQKIMQQHKGNIWLESTEGQGTTFCFTLPA